MRAWLDAGAFPTQLLEPGILVWPVLVGLGLFLLIVAQPVAGRARPWATGCGGWTWTSGCA